MNARKTCDSDPACCLSVPLCCSPRRAPTQGTSLSTNLPTKKDAHTPTIPTSPKRPITKVLYPYGCADSKKVRVTWGKGER